METAAIANQFHNPRRAILLEHNNYQLHNSQQGRVSNYESYDCNCYRE